jgi:hypothetical protein
VPLFVSFNDIVLNISVNKTDIVELKKTWVNAVVNNLDAYFYHRGLVFDRLLGIGQDACLIYQRGILQPNKYNIIKKEIKLHENIYKFIDFFNKNTYFFHGFFYLLFLIAFVFYSFFKKNFSLETLVLSSSGLLYLLSYFFIATTCDFRMFFWTVIVFLILLFYMLKDVFKKSKK